MENRDGEIWKPVDGSPYEVSSEGRCRRTAGGQGARIGRDVKPFINGCGYPCVNLGRKRRNCRIHQMVAAAFLGPANGLQVNHRDGVKANNQISNLEYVTPSENTAHAWRTGLIPARGRLTAEGLQAAKAYIEANFRSKPTTWDVASVVGLSRKTFGRKFVAATGERVEDHVCRLIIAEAKAQLLAGKKVFETSSSLGFPFPSGFSSFFSDRVGISPFKWKRENFPGLRCG